MDKISFSKGIQEIGNIIKKTKITPDVINIGGGFPSIYPDLVPEPLENYMSEIKSGLEKLKLEKSKESYLWFVRQILYEKIEKSLFDQKIHEKLNQETFNEKDISEIVKRIIKDLR